MTLDDIPTVEELAEVTGQSIEQLEKDRRAFSRLAERSKAENVEDDD